jgi:LAO/AO transport system kinase
MATRGSTGGLAAATGNVITVMDAFGFDYILIETVGVGQIELDIVDTCDTVVVVLVPESGDAIQTLKAGLMEIADIFAVNKADRPGSDILIAELDSTLHIKREKLEWKLPVIATEAINNKNIDKLLEAIEQHLEYSKSTGHFEIHRREQIKKRILKILQFHVNSLIRDKLTGLVDLDKIAQEIYRGKSDPHTASSEIIRLSKLD